MSKALKILQEKCGVTADGAFGPIQLAIARHYNWTSKRGARS